MSVFRGKLFLLAACLVSLGVLVKHESQDKTRSEVTGRTADNRSWAVQQVSAAKPSIAPSGTALAEGADTGDGFGQLARAVSDGWLATKVRSVIVPDTRFSLLSLDVEARNGIVTLRGVVNSELDHAALRSSIARIHGVIDIRPELQIAGNT